MKYIHHINEDLRRVNAFENRAGKPEYLVVSDKNSKILLCTQDWYAAVKLANLIRRGDGQVTIFKSTKG